jgi:hypothetical protein
MAEPSGDIIAVNVDQAKLVRLPSRVATIVVGLQTLHCRPVG